MRVVAGGDNMRHPAAAPAPGPTMLRCFAMRGLPGLVALSMLAAPAMGAVRAWEDVVTLPTYLEGPADLKPVLDAMTVNDYEANYPYANRILIPKSKANEIPAT